MAHFPDLEYVKTDLVATKGVAYAKYSRASSALMAVEAVAARGMVSKGVVEQGARAPSLLFVLPFGSPFFFFSSRLFLTHTHTHTSIHYHHSNSARTRSR